MQMARTGRGREQRSSQAGSRAHTQSRGTAFKCWAAGIFLLQEDHTDPGHLGQPEEDPDCHVKKGAGFKTTGLNAVSTF